MLDKLLDLLKSPDVAPAVDDAEQLRLSVAALLVEAAHMDQAFDEAERSTIARLLCERFDMTEPEAAKLLEDAEAAVADTTQYHPFVNRISENHSIEQRVEIIEMLWSVAYADGELDPHEDMLIRQIAGLLHVPDRDRGLARQRALAKLSPPVGAIPSKSDLL